MPAPRSEPPDVAGSDPGTDRPGADSDPTARPRVKRRTSERKPGVAAPPPSGRPSAGSQARGAGAPAGRAADAPDPGPADEHDTPGRGTGGRETADRETADRETADRETADRETADRETADRNTPGRGSSGGASPASDARSGPDATHESGGAAASAGHTGARPRMFTVLATAAAVLVVAAVLLGVAAFTAMSSGGRSNEAFVNAGDTSELVGQVTNAITTVYSYDYQNLPATENAAKDLVTGMFATEFGRVFGPVKQLAPQQQSVLRTTVPAVGVSLLEGDRARLLMMVDQAGVRGPSKAPTGATARLVVDAEKVDGRWKISGVTPE